MKNTIKYELADVGGLHAEVESGLAWEARETATRPDREQVAQAATFHGLIADVFCGSIEKVDDLKGWV